MEKRNSEQKQNHPLLDLWTTLQGSKSKPHRVDQILPAVRPEAALVNKQSSEGGKPRVITEKSDYTPKKTALPARGFQAEPSTAHENSGYTKVSRNGGKPSNELKDTIKPSADTSIKQQSIASAINESAPSVVTNKADYAPGETVLITASGFPEGDTISFAIADDPQDPGDDGDADTYTPFEVTDGGTGDLDETVNGTVVTSWQVPTDDDGSGSGSPDALNATLDLTATSSKTGQQAITSFVSIQGSGRPYTRMPT